MGLRDFLEKNKLKGNGAVPQVAQPLPPAVVEQQKVFDTATKAAQQEGGLRQAVNRFARPGKTPELPKGGDNNSGTKLSADTTKPPVVTAPDTQKPPAAIVAPREVPKAELVVGDLAQATVDDLRTALTYLAEHIEHKELVGQVVRRIAQMLIVNPQFSTQMPMERKDFNLLVRGLRRSYNVAARKKTEKSEEKAKKSLEKELNISELENLLNSF